LINQFKNKSSETNEPEKIIVREQCDMSKLFFETSLKNNVFYTISKSPKISIEKLHKKFELLINKNYNELVNNLNVAINQKFVKKLQGFETANKLKIEITNFFKKFKEFNKIYVFISSNFVSNYFVLNIIIATESMC
jgi:hypothetical protein